MNKKMSLLILVLVFALLMGGAYVLYDRLGSELAPDQLAVQTTTVPAETAGESVPTEAEINLAPDFTVYDMDGNPVRLSDFFGKPIVLNFWASWCGPCKMEMPEFQDMYLELGEEIQFLMVNMTDGTRETVEVASAFLSGTDYTFPVFFDTAGEAGMVYRVYSLPTTYFIDANGQPIAKASGAIDAETLQRGIDMIR